MNVSEHEGVKDRRESLRVRLASKLFYGRSARLSTGQCVRPVLTYPGLACIQVRRQTWKPAVCLAHGAPLRIDDKAVICEKCELAGIVPIYICCEDADHLGYHECELEFCRGFRGKESLLTVYSYEGAVRLICRLNSGNELGNFFRVAQEAALPNPWLNEQEGHLFAHLDY